MPGLLHQFGFGVLCSLFQIANHGMLADIHQGQPEQTVGRVAVATIQMVAVFDRIAAFHAAAMGIEGLEAFRGPEDGRKEPEIGRTFEVEEIAHFLVRAAVPVEGATVISMSCPS